MRTDLIINYASLEGLSSWMTSYKEALNNVYTAMDSLKEKLSTQESKAINKLKESMGDVGSESGNTIDTLDSLANVINNYTADMRDLVNAETEGIATRVDTSDIWFNLKQIKSSISYLDEMDCSLTGAYHCETGETAEEKKTIAKYESNYNTIENFRKTKLVALKNKVYSYMEDIDEIYDKRLKEYENLDDSYRKKIDSIYSEFTSGKNKFFDGVSFVGSVSWNFLKSFVKAAGTVVAVALVPEVAVVLLLLGGAKYAGCAIITYFPEDLFDSDLWHKIYNKADKEMSELAEVSRVALERGPLSLIGYFGQGYADKVQTPEGIASTTGEALGTFTGTAMAKKILSPEGQAKVSDIKEDLEDTFTKKTINEGVDVNGNKLNKELSELNEKFRGDKYKRKGTYERSLDKFDRDDLIKTNYDSTAKLDENLDGHIKDNSSYSGNTTYWQNKRATTARNEVSAVDSDTIMQKVITDDTYQKYINGDFKTVNGCVSKASDTAPYTSTPKEAYTNLRLDYDTTTFDSAGGEDIYVIRYTSTETPTNTDLPTIAGGYSPPCTEKGYLASPDHVIPEYDNKLVGNSGFGVKPSEAVIYKVSPDGTERMAAYWSKGKNKFIEIK